MIPAHKGQLVIGTLMVLIPAAVLLPFVQFSGENRGQINFYSIEDERLLGEEAVRRIEAETALIRNARVSEYLQGLGDTLAAGAGPAGITYEFRMLDTPLVNAFALPGGFVYVTSGLVTMVRNEAQLAGVLAHEIGHVAARHGTHQLSRDQLISFFTAVGDAVLIGLMYPHARPSAALTAVEQLSYTRADEIQADDLAARLLHQARYLPEGLAAFFDLIRESRRESALDRFMSTHPQSAERAQRLRARVATWPSDGRWIRDSRAFHEIRQMVRPRVGATDPGQPASAIPR
jgi:predicted Zn-dependent protease